MMHATSMQEQEHNMLWAEAQAKPGIIESLALRFQVSPSRTPPRIPIDLHHQWLLAVLPYIYVPPDRR